MKLPHLSSKFVQSVLEIEPTSAFIIELLLNGCVPTILQEIVGHADYETTQVYVQKVQTHKKPERPNND